MDSVSRQRGEGFVVVGQMVPQESNCEGLALGKIQDTIFFLLSNERTVTSIFISYPT